MIVFLKLSSGEVIFRFDVAHLLHQLLQDAHHVAGHNTVTVPDVKMSLYETKHHPHLQTRYSRCCYANSFVIL